MSKIKLSIFIIKLMYRASVSVGFCRAVIYSTDKNVLQSEQVDSAQFPLNQTRKHNQVNSYAMLKSSIFFSEFISSRIFLERASAIFFYSNVFFSIVVIGSCSVDHVNIKYQQNNESMEGEMEEGKIRCIKMFSRKIYVANVQ